MLRDRRFTPVRAQPFRQEWMACTPVTVEQQASGQQQTAPYEQHALEGS